METVPRRPRPAGLRRAEKGGLEARLTSIGCLPDEYLPFDT
jgi:hypothetical protein